MSTFTIGVFAYDGFKDLGGQSFTPNVPGPNGTGGGPGSASQVFIRSVNLGYPNANTSGRATSVLIYSVELTDPTQIGQSDYQVAVSSTENPPVDGSGLFGSGTYSRKFTFDAGALLPGTKYYLYFDTDQVLRFKGSTPYAGGNAEDDSLADLTDASAQFQIEFYT